jgi:hypothetical protein
MIIYALVRIIHSIEHVGTVLYTLKLTSTMGGHRVMQDRHNVVAITKVLISMVELYFIL